MEKGLLKEMRLTVWVKRKPAISSWWCWGLHQRSMRVIGPGGATLPGKHCLLPMFWGPRCDPECAGALHGKARHSCVIQGGGYRGAPASTLSLVRPGQV